DLELSARRSHSSANLRYCDDGRMAVLRLGVLSETIAFPCRPPVLSCLLHTPVQLPRNLRRSEKKVVISVEQKKWVVSRWKRAHFAAQLPFAQSCLAPWFSPHTRCVWWSRPRSWIGAEIF